MKAPSIAFIKAIVLSLCIVLPSGFLAMAAEGELAPPKRLSVPDVLPQTDNNELSEDELYEPNSVAAFDETENSGRAEDDQVPVGIRINKIQLDTDMTVYLPNLSSHDGILIPLDDLMYLLSFAINVNAGDKTAEGFFVKEENSFQLNANENTVLVRGKKRPLTAGEVEIHDNKIYAVLGSVEEWFDLSVDFDMSKLLLDVNTNYPLPFQDRLERLARADKKNKTFKFSPVRAENAVLAPYKDFSYPSLYINSSVGARSSSSNNSYNGRLSVQGNQDIAKFEANYVASGLYDSLSDRREISGARFTMQRRDLNKNLLGPLKAGRISFGDVSFPSVPLFAGSQRGAGFEVSSDPRLGSRYAYNSENFILDGDAPIGYDAELYRNGIFIAFQQIGEDGRYSFENINLSSGYNNFEIILYGPQGQKTVEKREVYRGSRMLRKGEFQYDFALGTPMGDLLPLQKEGKRDERNIGFAGQTFYGVNEYLTVGASGYSGPERLDQRNIYNLTTPTAFDRRRKPEIQHGTGAALSAATSFYGIGLQGQVLGADNGRRAYETTVTARPLGLNVGLTHTEYKNFQDYNQDVERSTEISLSRGFGKFNTQFSVQQTDFKDRESEKIFYHEVGFKLFAVNINNELIKTIYDSERKEDFQGQLTAAASLAGIRFRSSLLYDLDSERDSPYRRISFSGQKNLGNRTSIRAEGIHEFDSDIDIAQLTLSKDYDTFGLDLNAMATTDNNYAMTVGLRVALQPDEHNNYRLVDPKAGGGASLGARAFVDNNNNNVYDPDVDKILEGIAFKASSSVNAAYTGKDGVAYVTNLSEAPLRLMVQHDSIEDIYLAPVFEHRDLIPRRGSTPVIDFPFTKMSEIAGYLTYLKEGVEGAIVRLISVIDGREIEKTETDVDGYFIFPTVKGGNYKVSFGLPDREFLALNVVLDADIEIPDDYYVQADKDLAEAVKESQSRSFMRHNTSSAAQDNLKRLNLPAGDLPNIDDPLDEDDLKPLDVKDVESIIP